MGQNIFKPFNVNYSLACATCELREALNHVVFKDGYVYATDAHVLVNHSIHAVNNILAEDVEKLNGKSIKRDVFDKIFKSKGFHHWEINDDGFLFHFDGYEILYRFVNDPVKYPEVEEFFESAAENLNEKSLVKVCFDKNLFNLCSKLLIGNYVRLAPNENQNRPYILYTESYHPKDQCLILMPVMAYDDAGKMLEYKEQIEKDKQASERIKKHIGVHETEI